MQLKYYKELDGVRGLAAIMVVLFHIRQAGVKQDFLARIIDKAGNIGQTGVTLFFVLSGFLITRILLVSKTKPQYFSKFYIRRSLRIFPLYYLALAIYLLIIPAFTSSVSNGPSWPFWFYLQNVYLSFDKPVSGPVHFWSLAVEEHFYLIWPFVVYYLNDKWLLRSIGVIVFLTCFIRVLMLQHGYGHIFYFTLTTMDCMAIGGFLALNEKHQWFKIRAITIMMIATVVILGALWVLFKGEGSYVIQIVKLPATAILYMCLIGVVIGSKSILNKIFNFKVLQFTGKVSYGLYVFHPLCIEFIQPVLKSQPFALTLVEVFLSSYLIASLSYYGFELWFLRLKDRFENFSFKKSSVPTASNS